MALFDKELIQEEEKNYNRLELSDDQKPMMDGIAQIIEQFIDISHIALKGFIWRSLKDLQVNHNITTKEVASLPPEERGKYALEAFESLKGYLRKILRNSEDASIVDSSVDEAINFYKEGYMNR